MGGKGAVSGNRRRRPRFFCGQGIIRSPFFIFLLLLPWLYGMSNSPMAASRSEAHVGLEQGREGSVNACAACVCVCVMRERQRLC